MYDRQLFQKYPAQFQKWPQFHLQARRRDLQVQLEFQPFNLLTDNIIEN